jgi:hypothetical protein
MNSRTPASPFAYQDVALQELCDRILGGDLPALDELARHLLPILTRRLRRKNRFAPQDLVWNACADAILEYAANPRRFDPTRRVPIDRFLQVIAIRNLTDVLKADMRRQTREAAYAELQNWCVWPSETLIADRAFDAVRRIQSVVDEGNERIALTEWLKGERRTIRLASLLGLSQLSTLDQRREVKRFKDRMRKRASRL